MDSKEKVELEYDKYIQEKFRSPMDWSDELRVKDLFFDIEYYKRVHIKPEHMEAYLKLLESFTANNNLRRYEAVKLNEIISDNCPC